MDKRHYFNCSENIPSDNCYNYRLLWLCDCVSGWLSGRAGVIVWCGFCGCHFAVFSFDFLHDDRYRLPPCPILPQGSDLGLPGLEIHKRGGGGIFPFVSTAPPAPIRRQFVKVVQAVSCRCVHGEEPVLTASEGLAPVMELPLELLALGRLAATSAADVAHYPPVYRADRTTVAILIIW